MLVASDYAAVIISDDPTRRLRVSFLDRLKREAEQQRLQAEAVARERDERESRYRSQIEPQMKALTAYLEGLAATMLEVKPPISIPMAIQGYGDITLVPFWDYKVEHERRHRSFTINMSWSMRIDSERTPLVRAEGVTRVKALISIFRQYHLGGIKEEKRTPQGDLSCASFQARGYIKSRMEAQISADDPVLRLMFENASWLGSSRRQVPGEQINDGLFDRIARFIVREDDSLFTEELPDALRQRLRKHQEPAGQAAVQTPAQPPAPVAAEAVKISSEAAAPIAASVIEAPAVAIEPEFPSGFGQGMLAAPAPMTEGDVIEIDESKLGLSDFHEYDEPASAFSLGTPNRVPPGLTPATATQPPLRATTPPVAQDDVIAIDESKLGDLSQFTVASPPSHAATASGHQPQASVAPRSVAPTGSSAPSAPVIRQPQTGPGAAQRPSTVPVASAATPPEKQPASASGAAHNPHAAAAAHAAVLAQRAAAARAAAAQPTAMPPAPASSALQSPAAASGAPATMREPPSTIAPSASVAPGTPAASAEAEALDPAKEREAALFRLRMRAMMARLRTDEPDEPKA